MESKSWAEAVAVVSQKLGAFKGNEIRGIAGKLADAESMIGLKVNAAFQTLSAVSMSAPLQQLHQSQLGDLDVFILAIVCESGASALQATTCW